MVNSLTDMYIFKTIEAMIFKSETRRAGKLRKAEFGAENRQKFLGKEIA